MMSYYRNIRTHLTRNGNKQWGIDMKYARGQNTIVRVVPDSPADYADLRVGDIIVSANGIDCRRADLKEVFLHLHSQALDITVQRPQNNHEFVPRTPYATPMRMADLYGGYSEDEDYSDERQTPVIIDLVSDDDTPVVSPSATNGSNRHIISTSDDEVEILPPKRPNTSSSTATPTKRSKPSTDTSIPIKREPVGFGEADNDEVTEVRNPHPPPTPVIIEANLDDDVEFVGGTVSTISDMPHPREHCTVHKFHPISTPHNLSFCKNCFCYVCDIRSSDCKSWESHCHATFRNPQWKQMRQALTSEISIVPPERRGTFYDTEFKQLRNALSSFFEADTHSLQCVTKYVNLVQECMLTSGEYFPEALVISCKIIMYYANSYHNSMSSELRTELSRLLAYVGVSKYYTTAQKNFVNSKLPSLAQAVSYFKKFLALGQYMKDWKTYKNNFNATEKGIIAEVLIHAKYDIAMIEPILPMVYSMHLEVAMLKSGLYQLAASYVQRCDRPLSCYFSPPSLSSLQQLFHAVIIGALFDVHTRRLNARRLLIETVDAFPTTEDLIEGFRHILNGIKKENGEEVFEKGHIERKFLISYFIRQFDDISMDTAKCIALLAIRDSFACGCLGIAGSHNMLRICGLFLESLTIYSEEKKLPTQSRGIPKIVLNEWASLHNLNPKSLLEGDDINCAGCTVCPAPWLLKPIFVYESTTFDKESLKLYYHIAAKTFLLSIVGTALVSVMHTRYFELYKLFDDIKQVAERNKLGSSRFLDISVMILSNMRLNEKRVLSFERYCCTLSNLYTLFSEPITALENYDYSVLSYPEVDDLTVDSWASMLQRVCTNKQSFPIPYIQSWETFSGDLNDVNLLLVGLSTLPVVCIAREELNSDTVWLSPEGLRGLKQGLTRWATQFGTEISDTYLKFLRSSAGQIILKSDPEFFDGSLMTFLTAKTVLDMFSHRKEQLSQLTPKLKDYVAKTIGVGSEAISEGVLTDCIVIALCVDETPLVQAALKSLLRYDQSVYTLVDNIFDTLLTSHPRNKHVDLPDGTLQLIPYLLYSLTYCEEPTVLSRLRQYASDLGKTFVLCFSRAQPYAYALLQFSCSVNYDDFYLILTADITDRFDEPNKVYEIIKNYTRFAYVTQSCCNIDPASYLKICIDHMTASDVLMLTNRHAMKEYKISEYHYHGFLERLLKILPNYSLHEKLDLLAALLQLTLAHVQISYQYYWSLGERRLLEKVLESVSLVNNDTLLLHLIACPSVERYVMLVEQQVITDKCSVLLSLYDRDDLSIFIQLIIKEELFHLLLQPVVLMQPKVEECLLALITYLRSGACLTTLGLLTGPSQWSSNDRCMNAFSNKGFLYLVIDWLLLQRQGMVYYANVNDRAARTNELVTDLLDELLKLCEDCTFVQQLKQIVLTLSGDAFLEVVRLGRTFEENHPSAIPTNIADNITNQVLQMMMERAFTPFLLCLQLAIKLLTTSETFPVSDKVMKTIQNHREGDTDSHIFAEWLIKYEVSLNSIRLHEPLSLDLLPAMNERAVNVLNGALMEEFTSENACGLLRAWEPVVKRKKTSLALFECYCNNTTSLALLTDGLAAANAENAGDKWLSYLFPRLYDIKDVTTTVLPAFLLSPQFYQLRSSKWFDQFYAQIAKAITSTRNMSEVDSMRITLSKAFIQNSYSIAQSYMCCDNLMKLVAGLGGGTCDLMDYHIVCPQAFDVMRHFVDARNEPFITYLLRALHNVVNYLSTNRVSKYDRERFQILGQHIRLLLTSNDDVFIHWVSLLRYIKMCVGSKKYLLHLFQNEA